MLVRACVCLCLCVCVHGSERSYTLFVCACVHTDLEVYVLNTEADIQDLTFPHSYDSDSILQISALALQQYSSNGPFNPMKLLLTDTQQKKFSSTFDGQSLTKITPSSLAGQVKLVLTLYKNLGSFLTTQNSTLRLSLGLGQVSETRRRTLVVNSHVISASVHRGASRVYLSEPVIFTLRHLQVQLDTESCTPGSLQATNTSVYPFICTVGEPLWPKLLFLEFIRCLWERQVVHTGLPSITHQQHTHNLCLQPPLQLCCPHDL